MQQAGVLSYFKIKLLVDDFVAVSEYTRAIDWYVNTWYKTKDNSKKEPLSYALPHDSYNQTAHAFVEAPMYLILKGTAAKKTHNKNINNEAMTGKKKGHQLCEREENK